MSNKLSRRAESILKEILSAKDPGQQWYDKVSSLKDNYSEFKEHENCAQELEDNGYVNFSWSDGGPYWINNITNQGLEYFQDKEECENKEKKLNKREYKIAIISALIGAIVGLIPYLVTLLTGGK